jgi:hypothetical protein
LFSENVLRPTQALTPPAHSEVDGDPTHPCDAPKRSIGSYPVFDLVGVDVDKITTGMLREFCENFDLKSEAEDVQFENFATYLTVRRHYSETSFDPADLVTGSGGDTGIDGIAFIVNNALVTDVDQIQDLLDVNKYLEISFIFVQAKRSSSFETAQIGQLGFGVIDFFGKGTLPRNEAVTNAAHIMNELFANSSKFSKGNPECYLYYVTTGKWLEDANFVARMAAVTDDLLSTNNFSRVEVTPIGADQLHRLYHESKNSISREFIFENRTVIPDIENVEEAHLGYMPARDFLKLLCDEDGKIIESLFYENVRGYHGYNEINSQIKETLTSDDPARFVLMNNGVTIIAKTLRLTGHKFTMTDFQVVNGCQTSHVLHDNLDVLTPAVRIPIRIICTQDEAVIESIITATNSQTEVKNDQFFALKGFAKKLEAYFNSFDREEGVYYERRPHQYDSQNIEKTRIVAHQNLVRAFGGMFLQEPHRTTKTYRLLIAKVGKDMFCDTDRLEPYYLAAFALVKLEYLFRSKKIQTQMKPARFHILLAARLLMDPTQFSRLNSNDMGKRCDAMIKTFHKDWEKILIEAVERVKKAANDNLDRDYVRTEPVTEALLESFGYKKPGPKAATIMVPGVTATGIAS